MVDFGITTTGTAFEDGIYLIRKFLNHAFHRRRDKASEFASFNQSDTLKTLLEYEPGSSSGKALGYGLDGPGSFPGVGAEGCKFFLHSFLSRLILRSTQSPVK